MPTEAAIPAKLTEQDIEACVVEADFHVPEGTQLTICTLALRNGFVVTGESACITPEAFDAVLGRSIARRKAVEKIWPLEAYLMKERRAHAVAGSADQVGWLVEHGPAEGPVYLHMKQPGPGWTRDAFKAVRFARREDAQAALEMYGPEYGRVAEHAFDG